MSLPAGRLVRGSAREVLLSSCCVNYQQRRLQDSGVESWHIHPGPVLSAVSAWPSTAGSLGAGAPSLPLSLLPAAHAGAPTPAEPPPTASIFILFYFIIIFFLSGTHGRPIDFDPQISVSRDRSLSRPGEVTETSVYSLSQRKTERREKERRCNKCGVRDDRACDLMFSPLRFLSFFVVRAAFSVRSLSVATGFLMSLLLPAACRPSLGSRQRSWRSQSDSGL